MSIELNADFRFTKESEWFCDDCSLTFQTKGEIDPIRCPFPHQPSISDVTGE